eukprot:6173810-Amphidinium_carterae.1
MKQQRGAFPEGDKQVVVERLHWGCTNEMLKTTAWDTVKPDGNLFFYLCLSLELHRRRGVWSEPEALKQGLTDKAMLMADHIATCLWFTLETVQRDIRETQQPGGMANEKILICAAIEDSLPMVDIGRLGCAP